MEITKDGVELIKRFEGLRKTAYRCPSGVWTIGYGHTAAAGPPVVAGGMEIAAEQAEAILARDLAGFAAGVKQALTAEVSDAQFSALVSFAYNVGLGQFRGSSVLKAVNAGDMAAVPRRLLLWNRAGGQVLPGLTRRRAAEAELFLSGASSRMPPVPRGDVSAGEGKPLHRSSTVLAAILAAVSGVVAALGATSASGPLRAVLALIIAGAAVWIIRERIKKSRMEGV